MNSGLKILVADDEVLIQKAFILAAQSRSHIVKVARDGREALKLWASFDPDLIFLDVLMPYKDGFQVLKERPQKSRAKIIMISAHNELDDTKIQATSVDLFVKKPFEDIYELIQKGEHLIKRDKQNEQGVSVLHRPEN